MGRNTLFVDTGAWYALADRSDQHHNEAVEIYPKLLSGNLPLKTTNLIDAVSFVAMKQNGITEAFSFDKHFVTAGFTLIP
jgi:predicted nucleic acid-binding protein